jgi:hypothetical protein
MSTLDFFSLPQKICQKINTTHFQTDFCFSFSLSGTRIMNTFYYFIFHSYYNFHSHFFPCRVFLNLCMHFLLAKNHFSRYHGFQILKNFYTWRWDSQRKYWHFFFINMYREGVFSWHSIVYPTLNNLIHEKILAGWFFCPSPNILYKWLVWPTHFIS